MSRLVWFVAYGLIALWTLLAWGGNALLSTLLDTGASSVHSVLPPTELADWVIWSLHRLDDFSGPIVGLVWFIGAAAIYGIAWLITRLGRNSQQPVYPPRLR